MDRTFLLEKELIQFKNWVATNGLAWEENPEIDVVFEVIDGQFNFYISPTSDPELFEVFDVSNRGTAKKALDLFFKNGIFLYGVEVPKAKIEKFLPEHIKPCVDYFDHFRIAQKQDKLWDLLGVVGYHTERLCVCNYKLPLKVFGNNFQETYWTLIYTSKKDTKAYVK